MWDVHRHFSCMNHYHCWPGLQHLWHRVHLHVAVEGLERSSTGCQVVEVGRYVKLGWWSDALRIILRSCYESNGYDVEDPRERSILPADMQGPPSPPLSEAQQSCPPTNEEDEERETVT